MNDPYEIQKLFHAVIFLTSLSFYGYFWPIYKGILPLPTNHNIEGYWVGCKLTAYGTASLTVLNALTFPNTFNDFLVVVGISLVATTLADSISNFIKPTVAPVPAPAVSNAPKLCGFEVKIRTGAESTGRLDETGTNFARIFQTKYYVEVKTYPQLGTLLEKLFDKATGSNFVLSYEMKQLMLEVPRLEDPSSVYMGGHLVYFIVSSDRSIDQLVINSNGKKQYLSFGVNFVGDRKAHPNSDRVFKPSYLVDVTEFVEVYGLDA